MSTVKFTLMGLAVCYRKGNDEFWTVKFPTDEKHRAKFRYAKDGRKKSSNPIELAGKTIIIKAPDALPLPPNGYAEPSFNEGVLDLSGKYLHTTNGVIKHPMSHSLTQITELKIPKAKLSSAYPRRGRLNYTFPFGKPKEIKLVKAIDEETPQQLTMIVGGEIKLPTGKGIIVEISGEDPIPLWDGDRFHIDNDCHCTPETNDFRIYHKLFKDKRDESLKYEAISIKDPTFDGKPYDIEEIIRILDLPGRSDKSIDKMMTSPPPDVCEIIRIGKADKLD